MKKLLAAAMAVFTAAVMTGCEKPADEQIIEDITDEITTASETELPETSVTEEVTETAAETVTEIPGTTSGTAEAAVETETSEEETEIVSDTETTVEEETVTEAMAEADFPIGKWIETRAYIYEFDENGNVSVDTGFYNIKGTYEYNGSELRLRLISGWNKAVGYVFSVEKNGDSAELVYTDYFDTEFMDPYEPVGLMTGYMSVLGGLDKLTLEPFTGGFIPAEHEDLNGVWLCPDYKYNYYPTELYIYDGNSRNVYKDGKIISTEFHIKNGFEIYDKDYSFVIELDDHDETVEFKRSYMLYDDKLYIDSNYDNNPEILVRYNKENISSDYFNGVYESIIGTFTLQNGKGTIRSIYGDENAQIIVNGDKIFIDTDNFKAEYNYYFVDRAILLYNSEVYNSEEHETYKDYIVLTKKEK